MVFIDMDGVITDFMVQLQTIHPCNLKPDTWLKLPNEVWAQMGYEFWANMPWTSDGEDILKIVHAKWSLEKVYVATSPCETPGCIEGKRAWIKKHLPVVSKRLVFLNCKEALGTRGNVLIDDGDHNIEGFRAAGGSGILVPRPWNKNRSFNTIPYLYNIVSGL
jgi:5'(3')-deoxyribonucleotidase